jgi:aminoglycoside phosphotransferase (APT) family kinase protein
LTRDNQKADCRLRATVSPEPIIAHTISELDTAFFDRVLAGGCGELRRATCRPMGTGQMATSVLADLQWASAAPTGHVVHHVHPDSVVVKIAPLDPDSRNTGIRHGSYRREVGFYQHLAALVRTPVPTCLHAAIDSDSGDFTLVLTRATGTVGDQLRGCSPAEAVTMVDAAVGLHAPTWNRTDLLTRHPWLPQPDDAVLGRRGTVARNAINGFRERYAHRLGSEVLEAATWAAAHLEDIARAHVTPLCLVHGDFRIDNMLFDEAGGADRPTVTVVDWQTVSMGRGPDDVAYALGAGLPTDDRRLHETALLRRYCEGLEVAGVPVTAEEIGHDHRLGTATGLLMAVIASQQVVRTERGDEMFAVMAERHAAHMADQRIDQLVG